MENKLTNIAHSSGKLNNQQTDLTSNEITIPLGDGLKIEKSASKSTWLSGNLTFTIKITNLNYFDLPRVVLFDKLEIGKISLIGSSVKLDGLPIATNLITYDEPTGSLSVNLGNILANNTHTLTFQVKKIGAVFRLENTAHLYFSGNDVVSNTVVVIAKVKPQKFNGGCDTPRWRC